MKTKSSPLDQYIQSIVHSWSRTLAALGFCLIPAFFMLDYFMMPAEQLTRFALYRLGTTAIIIAQYFVLRATRPGPSSLLHGYFFSLVASEMIVLMTVELGGFNSSYYAGLNLVMIAVNLMLPWQPVHSALNSTLIIGLYIGTNLAFPSKEPINPVVLINNFYFLVSTAIVSVAINWVKERLIRQEFLSRSDLQTARDALWSEIAVAKRIQTSLQPKMQRLVGCRVAAVMVPAEEVGGDYYDVIQNEAGEIWISIGDVSGHGVESGLI
ncbi:MAG: serine/threonine-protein phosphatase, partial [Myxococcaceae bacterium]|nr:serine/threonine-protein phosphatase [Myxococcaceae bacterium]